MLLVMVCYCCTNLFSQISRADKRNVGGTLSKFSIFSIGDVSFLEFYGDLNRIKRIQVMHYHAMGAIFKTSQCCTVNDVAAPLTFLVITIFIINWFEPGYSPFKETFLPNIEINHAVFLT